MQDRDGDYGKGGSCDESSGSTVLHSNEVFTPTGKVTECGMSLAAWQAKGNDINTTAAPYPASSTVIFAAARTALGMN